MALAYHFDPPTKSYLTARLTQVEMADVRRLAGRTARVIGSVLAITVVTTILLAIRFAPFMPQVWR